MKILTGLKDRLIGTQEARLKTATGIATFIGTVVSIYGTDLDPTLIAGIATGIATVLGLLGK